MGKLSALRVGTLNCQGLNDYYKRMAVFDMLQNSDLSIIFIQETKLKPDYHYKYSMEWTGGESIFNSVLGGKSGTAILLKGTGVKFCDGTKMLDLEGRVISVDIELQGSKFHLVNSYGPNENEQKISYLNRLHLFLDSSIPTIWAGDHNLTQIARQDRYPIRLNNDRGSKEFMEMLDVFDLKDVCRFLYPNQKIFTFHRGTCKSRIDSICVSACFCIKTYGQEDTSFSDHELIKTTLLYENVFDRGPGMWKNNVKYYRDDDFLDNFKYFWHQKIINSYGPYRDNVVTWWLDFKYSFKMYYIKLSREKLLMSRRHDQMLENGLHYALMDMHRCPNDTQLIGKYNTIKKQLMESRIRKTKERIFKSEAQYLMMGEKPIKSFFEKFKNKKENKPITSLKDESGEEIFDKGMIKIAENFYRKLFTPRETNQSIINLFLNNIQPVECENSLLEGLTAPFSF